MTAITIRLLEQKDLPLLLAVTEGLFDHAIDPDQARAFLADPLHMLALAFDGDLAVGMASGTVLLHPDKQPSLFVNEVGTREEWERRGIATSVLEALFAAARARGCKGIWVATEPDNDAARGLYRKLGGDEIDCVAYGWDGAFDEDLNGDLNGARDED
ncbi:MAG: GNAT family N-acetyltransferase [Rubellimicrobium sp.]|nr:GNAT family N-acetyltransferase [Rubellimicrobium sp.]